MTYDTIEEQKERVDKTIGEIKELYKGELPEGIIDHLVPMVVLYGGTLVSKAAVDIYESIIYGEIPQGPNR